MNAVEEALPKKIGLDECNVCGEQHDTSQCPLLPIVQKVEDESIPSRARLTLPHNLTLTEVNGHVGVVAKEKILTGTQFGPLDAPKVTRLYYETRFPLKLFFKDSSFIYLNTADESKCNWMCLVTSSKDENEQNLIAYQLRQDIYFSSKKEIKEGDELIVGYAFAYGKKMAMSETSSEQNVNATEGSNITTSVKRKRGRPPKSSKFIRARDSTEKNAQGKNSVDETSVVEESLVRTLGARELGIIEEQQEWKCSQCGFIFLDCLEFARHLQGHYKPTNYSRGRGRGRGRGRRKMWKKHVERPAVLHNEPEKEIEITDQPETTIEQESSPTTVEQDNFFSQQGDSGIDGDMEKDTNEIQVPNEDSSSETISIPGTVNSATQTYSSRGRKRKSEVLDKEGEDEEDKKYEFVSREIPQSVSTKYNLRTTRKALVIPKEEIDEQDGTDYDDEDDTDYEDENFVSPYRSSEEPPTETLVTIPRTISNTLEPLSIAANEILSSLIEQTQKDMAEQGPIETEIQDMMETSNISQPNEKRIIQMSMVQAKHFNSKRQGRYKCDLCGKGFSKTLYLYRHIRKHTGEFTCSKCHRVFARKENMLKHNCPGLTDVQEGKELDYHCPQCNKAFAAEKMLECHMAKHRGEFRCEDCGKSYSTKDSLTRHVCPVKPSTEEYVCGICHKSFTKETYLLKHLPVHTGIHSCQICGKWLRSFDSLTNHMRMCSQVKEIEENGEAKCPNCHKVFTEVSEYRRHQYEHTHLHMCDTCGARFRNLMSLKLHVCQGKVIECDICGKMFTSISNLQRHKQTHGDPEFKCEECGKAFHRKDTLLKHSCEQVKQGLPALNKKKKSVCLMPLICEKCGSMFSSTSSLNVHRNLHGEKKFSCEECGKKFHRKDLLLEHHAVHGSPTYPCAVCQKLFKTKKSLDIHMMIHDGIKRFKCETCGKAFFQKGNLQKHEETHESDRKYVCSICNKSFGRKQYFKLHLLEHSRGRIYSCGVCGRSFVKEHQLRSHHRMFHSNRIYNCSYCGLTLKLRHSLKRHLRKKHGDYEDEWRNVEFINAMLTTKDQAQQNTDNRTETYLMTDGASAQEDPSILPGAEVLLAVAGLGNQELSEAIASGRAQIKQGSTPHTFEISVPFAYNNGSEENAEEQIILATGETNNMNNSGIDKTLQIMCSDGKAYRITLPLEASEMQTSEGGEYQITLPMHEEVASENQQCEVSLPMQEISSAEGEYEITLQQENSNEEHLEVNVLGDCTNQAAVEREHYQILSEISSHVEAQYEEIQPEEITLGKQYQIESPQENNETEQYQLTIPKPQDGINETEEFQITLDEQTSTDLVAQTEDGQQIVISGQNLPVGTHHIVLDTANIQQIADGNLIQSEDAIVLEEGTILQRSGDDLLVYVLADNQLQ